MVAAWMVGVAGAVGVAGVAGVVGVTTAAMGEAKVKAG